jgi:hypothetical protein
MNAILDPAVDRFRSLMDTDEDGAELWRKKLTTFRNLYAFLSQVIPYQDSDLEKLYTYLRHLASKLPRRRTGPQYAFDDDVRLEYFRLQKISEGSISLNEGKADPLDDKLKSHMPQFNKHLQSIDVEQIAVRPEECDSEGSAVEYSQLAAGVPTQGSLGRRSEARETEPIRPSLTVTSHPFCRT